MNSLPETFYKRTLLLCLLCFFAAVFSQDTTYRYLYDFKTSQDFVQKEVQYVLDVNKDNIKFYQHDFLVADSLFIKYNRDIYKAPIVRTYNDITLTRNFKDDFFMEQKTVDLMDFYLVRTPYKKQIWKLSDEKKEVSGLLLQKATTTFGGRNWIAWFAAEIPFPYGPYKFAGLPGLIVEIHDDQNKFSFELLRSQKLKEVFDTSNFLETDFGYNWMVLNEKQFHKLLLEYYSDPMRSQPIDKDRNVNQQIQSRKERTEQARKTLHDLLQDGIEIEEDNL